MNIKDKYPEGCFEHWLAMLSTMNTEYTKDGFERQIEHYLNFEGKVEMQNLKSELILILESGDLCEFMDIAKQFNIQEVNEQTLEIMTAVIKNWKL